MLKIFRVFLRSSISSSFAVHRSQLSINNLNNSLHQFLSQPPLPTSPSFSKRPIYGVSRFSSLPNDDDAMTTNRYSCDYARLGTSSCKKCKQKLEKGSLRLAKHTPNPFGDGDGDMKQYFHPKCMFETFVKARATTKIVDDPDDLEGFDNLKKEDQDSVLEMMKEISAKRGSPAKTKPPKKKDVGSTPNKIEPVAGTSSKSSEVEPVEVDPVVAEKDNSFREYRKLCANIAAENSHTVKTAIVAKFLRNGTSGVRYEGDAYLLLKLLLPGVVKTVYNLHDKQLVKIFSQIFGANLDDMVENLELGDVSETIYAEYEKSTKFPPTKKSSLSLHEVDDFLAELSQYTKEDDQQKCLTKITQRCTTNDLKMVVRLIKHDIRINCGAKLILDGLDPNAHEAFKASRDLKEVVGRVLKSKDQADRGELTKKLSVKTNLMTPVQPMLAEACKSVEQAFKKCPNGMYAEIKYDGERVQVHKKGNSFQYFSRSLKPVLDHKVRHFKDFIPKAFPSGSDLILDAEVLLIDTTNGKPLPFGTLGVHKKKAFQDANVCLFVFDCLHYNGESLMQKSIKERRQILNKNMVEVKNHVMFSEMQHITEESDLVDLMMKVFREGLEGLVLKDVNSIYEPGMRHWLKVKKDYLAQGAMADSADLVVLGAYFGTGSKGGIKSVFLMGVYDEDSARWCTVTKCGSGFDDKTLDKLQTSIAMTKISKDVSQVPKWLNVTKTLVPDFVVQNPQNSPVWEIIGTEFSKSESHTAGGISIRFPRCLKFREDKSWKQATNLSRLKELFEKSKERSDMEDVFSGTPKKSKSTPTKNAKKKKVPTATLR